MNNTSQITSANVGELISKARINAGLSLRALAERAGTSHATLLAYEKGLKSPSVNTYLRIIEAAGYSVSLLTQRRIRAQDTISRSDELVAVLALAEQFPSKIPRYMENPPFPKRRVT